MLRRLLFAGLVIQCVAMAVIIDRIAVVVGNSIVKDSDIERDIRVTGFLNGDPLNLGAVARKRTASHLVDQIFIRREIMIGDYPTATLQEADQQLDELKKERFRTSAAFEQALRRYGISALDLRSHFQWQLTVLRFIDVRFKPAILVTDEEVAKYYAAHKAEFAKKHPGKAALEDVQDEIRDLLTGERVNELFFAWLDDQRKNAKIQYREASLA